MAAESHYKEKLLRRCCQDGLRDVPMPYSCTRRSFYITESWECIRAFRHCCATYRGEEIDSEMPTTTTTTSAPTTTVRPKVSGRTNGGVGVMAYGKVELTRERFSKFFSYPAIGFGLRVQHKELHPYFRPLLFLPELHQSSYTQLRLSFVMSRKLSS